MTARLTRLCRRWLHHPAPQHHAPRIQPMSREDHQLAAARHHRLQTQPAPADRPKGYYP